MAIRSKSPQELIAQQQLVSSYLESNYIKLPDCDNPEEVYSSESFIPVLRSLREKQEAAFRKPISGFIDHFPMKPEEEQREISSLTDSMIDISSITEEERKKISLDFPSGNFLYHGSSTANLISIFMSGDIVNGRLLMMRQITAGTHIRSSSRNNGGLLGVSWSMNNIDALPGDRFHLAGFLVSPEHALSNDQRLVIPSKPAPFEVLQVSNSDEPEDPKVKHSFAKEGYEPGNISVPIEKTFFVAPKKDALLWLQVNARVGHKPAGILLYDDKKIKLENFASIHNGDHSDLADEIISAIPTSDGYIRYEQILGTKFDDSMRTGHRNQFISDEFLGKTSVIEKNGTKLVVK